MSDPVCVRIESSDLARVADAGNLGHLNTIVKLLGRIVQEGVQPGVCVVKIPVLADRGIAVITHR